MATLQNARILIVDLRSQLTESIERTNRELGYRSAVLSPKKAGQWLRAGNETDAIILSGGDFSVYEEGAPQAPGEVFTACRRDGSKIPKLGICYGHQLIASTFGARVVATHAEHGRFLIRCTPEISVLFAGTQDEQEVLTNHGDTVISQPNGFVTTARSRETGAIAALENIPEGIFTVQFHPESTHTEYGRRILQNFLEFAGCKKDWQPSSLIDITRGLLDNEYTGERVVCGVSGGVDSTVCAAIAAPVLKERLLGFTLDANQLRLNELDEVILHAKAAGIEHRVIDMRDSVALFAGVTDAAKKRELFQSGIYVPGTRVVVNGFRASCFLQGTLKPDLIESGATGGDEIKRHHNVGISKILGIPLLEPLCNLFKYEVRALAIALGLPESVSGRKPFPGPGLFIRVVGVQVDDTTLECERWATHKVETILQSDKVFWDELSQPVVALFGTPTVGQKGDKRVYRGSIVTRAVKTLDYMTAEGLEIPPELRREIKREVTKHPLVVRSFFDETDKPPGTTEFE